MRLVAAHQIRTADRTSNSDIVRELFESISSGDTSTLRCLAGARVVFLGRRVTAGELTDIAEEQRMGLVPGSVRTTSGWELGPLADDLAGELFGGPVDATDTVALADLTISGRVFTAGVVIGRGDKPVRRVFDPSRARQLLSSTARRSAPG